MFKNKQEILFFYGRRSFVGKSEKEKKRDKVNENKTRKHELCFTNVGGKDGNNKNK